MNNSKTQPLTEPTLFYAPPYERPLEDEFAWHLVKYMTPETALVYQHRAETPCGPFWIDFVVEMGARRIGFEIGDIGIPHPEPCDHPWPWREGVNCHRCNDTGLVPNELGQKERMRDAAIIGCGSVDVLYRFRAEDVIHRLHDCLRVVAAYDPALFSPRGRINLDTMCSDAVRSIAVSPATPGAHITYPDPAPPATDEPGGGYVWPSESAALRDLHVHRLALGYPMHWLRDYDDALRFYGVTPEVTA